VASAIKCRGGRNLRAEMKRTQVEKQDVFPFWANSVDVRSFHIRLARLFGYMTLLLNKYIVKELPQ
jgi:hypothetical protein